MILSLCCLPVSLRDPGSLILHFSSSHIWSICRFDGEEKRRRERLANPNLDRAAESLGVVVVVVVIVFLILIRYCFINRIL